MRNAESAVRTRRASVAIFSRRERERIRLGNCSQTDQGCAADRFPSTSRSRTITITRRSCRIANDNNVALPCFLHSRVPLVGTCSRRIDPLTAPRCDPIFSSNYFLDIHVSSKRPRGAVSRRYQLLQKPCDLIAIPPKWLEAVLRS